MNMSEAVIYLDRLSNALEVLRKKQDQLDRESPKLEDIKIKKSNDLNFPGDDNCDITFNNAQEIYEDDYLHFLPFLWTSSRGDMENV